MSASRREGRCHPCLENDDLVYYMIQFLHPLDFLPLERLNKRFQHLLVRSYDQLLKNPLYEHFWFKENQRYSSKKQRIYRIIYNQQQHRGGFLLFGGNFGSVRTATVWIDDNPHELTGKFFPKVSSSGILGSVGMCIDSRNQLYVVGGWQELHERVVPTCSIYDLTTFDLTQVVPLDGPRCFSSATSTKLGHVIVSGGGDSPYRGAVVANTCLIKSQDQQTFLSNVVAPLSIPRCGHSSVTYLNDHIYVLGGYSGGYDYLETMEYYSSEHNQWYKAPSMSVKRSGLACALGPYGSIYVCGGSSDGTEGHSSLERYDPREGKWFPLASMYKGRGYCAGAIGASGLFYVSGGLEQAALQGGMECYDFKLNKWFGLSGSNPASELHNYGRLSIDRTSWTNQFYSKKIIREMHQDVFSMQLLRASHQLIYIE